MKTGSYMNERTMLIGLITSSEYLRQIQSIWNTRYIQSSTAKRMAKWCWDYYEQYNQAPRKNIEGIFYSKAERLPKDLAEEIELDILPGLSEEYEQEDTNLDYLLTETKLYFDERNLELHIEEIKGHLAAGDMIEAKRLASEYRSIAAESVTDIDLSSPDSLPRIEHAYNYSFEPLIRYPGPLGRMWNRQLVRGAFVALVGIEKRGKTFWLLDIALRAVRQGRKVAFFQAGDMTESQQIKRIGTYITRRPDLEEYAVKMFRPVRDCIYNQTDECDEEVRECDHGVWDKRDPKKLRKEVDVTELKELLRLFPNYRPCTNCKRYEGSHWGIPWLEEVAAVDTLTTKEAMESFERHFIKRRRQFKLSSHANSTLSVQNIKAILASWEKQDGFIPDVIVIDYADLLVPSSRVEFRHQQNEIWKQLRNLSQEKGQPLVVTATQADADAYDKNRLGMKNFSEDKRKNAHVTAQYGLNQDTQDREKNLKLMRINEIVVREGSFSSKNEVTVLQNLERGRPFLGSFL